MEMEEGGDSALNENIPLTKSLNKILNFDKKKELYTVRVGFCLKQLLRNTFQRDGSHVSPALKWLQLVVLLPVTYMENHYIDGCFSNLWRNLKLYFPTEI